ncbi:replication initiator [Spirillospora sp. NPDC047279]|uniref:replication initiator n=1 Tax=Spirillospora sp. NPDC047279 TaxID=3155478 RepID=UPI0033D2ACEE
MLTAAILERAADGYAAWLEHVRPAAGCSRPVRLFGELDTVAEHTGEIQATARTADMPDGVLYKACGNRRHKVCPSCAYTYQGDAFQLIRAGLVGGKTISPAVAANPAVFATFTAPSFGQVHTRPFRRHLCRDKSRCSCRPDPCHARSHGSAETCPHGVTLACFARHELDDSRLGQPLCLDCYDHDAHVVWNHQAGELWRRTKQAIERHLNHTARRRGLPPVRVAHGKVAEYQARGAVHFHAVLRLDGHDPDNPTSPATPPAGLTAIDLHDAVHHAAATITHTTPAHPGKSEGWRIAWGGQTKVTVITMTGADPLTDQMVAGYLAKYATKGTEITGHTSRRLDERSVTLYADPDGTHTERLIAAAWHLGDDPDWAGLRRWAHMLGFGGHFLTKGRRYSVTFSYLRQARALHHCTSASGPEPDEINRQDHLDTETTLVVGRLTYVGTGWHTIADALLANTAADQARRRHQAGREDLAHEHAHTTQLLAA